MATSPLGNFADLSSYRRSADAARGVPVNPLDELIAGFSQGQAVRNLPQTLETQRQLKLEGELTRRLNNAILQQKLTDLQNPDQAIAREVQKALAIKSADPATGVVSMPAGLAGETIGQPGALSPEQQTALLAGGAAPTVAPVGVPITPVTVAGQPTGFGTDLSGAAAATEAMSTAKGTSAMDRLLLTLMANKDISAAKNASNETIADNKPPTVLYIDPNTMKAYRDYAPGRVPMNQMAFSGAGAGNSTPAPATHITSGILDVNAPSGPTPQGRTKSDVSIDSANKKLDLRTTKIISDHVNQLRKDVESNHEIKDFQKVYRNFQNLDSITKDALSSANQKNSTVRTGQDTAAIDAFNLIFNPQGVVRQFSYVNTLQNRPVLDQGASIIQRYLGTGGKITTADLNSLSSLAKIALENSKATALSNIQPIVQDATDSGIPLNRFLPDYLRPENLKPTGAALPVANTPKEYDALPPGDYIGPDGKRATKK